MGQIKKFKIVWADNGKRPMGTGIFQHLMRACKRCAEIEVKSSRRAIVVEIATGKVVY